MLDTRNLIRRCPKYVLFAFICVCLVILLMNAGASKHIWLNYSSSSEQTLSTIRSVGEDLTICFMQPVLDGIKDSSTRSELNLQSVVAEGNQTNLHMNVIFNKLLASLDIKAVVIEPSILHCLLQPEYKEQLEKRNVTIANFSKSTTTYGILRNDVAKLQSKDTVRKFRRFGYQPHFIQTPLADWMLPNKKAHDSGTYTSHVFYMFYEWTIHVVVFQKRHNYLWHAAYESDDVMNVPKKEDLLYANYDSAYEKFNFVSLKSRHPSLANVYIPSDPHYFLFQTTSSRFLECNVSRAGHVAVSADTPTAHAYLSVEKFNSWAIASLRELKILFNPLLMNFWIFSGTMLGWYRQCDVIPYTTDVDFGAWASEISDLDSIISYFRDNKNLTIVERMGMLEEALEFQLRFGNLRVDVFFMYKINNGSWASGHRPSKGYYFRYHYPPFSLCTAELLGERVNVPCETEEVIVSEYGPNWMIPVSSWYYESSIKNRGPNIYWDEKKREKAFQEY